MAQDLMSQFYTCLNLPLEKKVMELTRIIDQSSANKDLQALYPQLINNLFASSFANGWGLRTITYEANKYMFKLILQFLEPQGPMFRLCHKLLSDPQLKYNIPLNVLPLDLQRTLERGRCPQFYADMLTTDSQTLNVVALALNPFDYYILNFALHLINNNQDTNSWKNWTSVYFSLACDYLTNFLPCDPNLPVLPHISNYTGKAMMAAPLQTSNRPLHSSSLLLLPDLSGLNNQHTSPQIQSRNEVWRSETILQIFIDVWMSVEEFSAMNVEMFQKNYSSSISSLDRVRIVRVFVKHLHSFSANHLSDPALRFSALRKYARQLMRARTYNYIKHLVTTWPLDASFRLVLELWLSFIQPWRYNENTINHNRFSTNNNQVDPGNHTLDASFMQLIAENFPSYTYIFQLVLPRFMRLDLTTYKNAIMLFRLGKVFSQQHLVPILKELERGITANSSGIYSSPDNSFNQSNQYLDQSYTYDGVGVHKWVSTAKQAISELNLSTNFEYDPIWSDNQRPFAMEFVEKIFSAKMTSEKIIEKYSKRLNVNNEGIWASIKDWFMIGNKHEEELILEECNEVHTYLEACIHYFSTIFELNESMLIHQEPLIEDNSIDRSSFANSINFPMSTVNKLRNKSAAIQYKGDLDLMPIASYESTVLVRMFYQIASKFNEAYEEEFSRLWNRNDFWGYIAREILQAPCTVQTYVKDSTSYQNIVSRKLPARLSLRRFGSHVFVAWITIGYFVFKLFSYDGPTYMLTLVTMWTLYILIKVCFKMLRIIRA